MKTVLNQRYAELCKDLGHLQVSKLEVERRIETVLAEIRALDNFSKTLKEVPRGTEPERK